MNKPDLLATSLTALCVAGVILYRLAWAGSSLAAAAGQGRLPILPKRLRNWLWGEHHSHKTSS
jgi:hypothetical protein